jgi:hypothetical protein
MVYGEPLAGIAAYVRALGAAFEIVEVGPEPNPAVPSMRQPQVSLRSATGVPVVPAEVGSVFDPLSMEVDAELFSCMVTVKPDTSLVFPETVSLEVDCNPPEVGVMAPKVTVGPDVYDNRTGLIVKPTTVVLVSVSA